MTQFDFSEPSKRLETFFQFLEYWRGPRRNDYGFADSLLDAYEMPDPLRQFFSFAGSWVGRNGLSIFYNSVPVLCKPPYSIDPQDGQIIFAHYLGEYTAHTLSAGIDPSVFEIDGEHDFYDDSLSHYLTRMGMRQLATQDIIWGPIAGYEMFARQVIADLPPLVDASWHIPHVKNDSEMDIGSRELVWLLEDGDVLMYLHEDQDGVCFNARSEEVVKQLIKRHGTTA